MVSSDMGPDQNPDGSYATGQSVEKFGDVPNRPYVDDFLRLHPEHGKLTQARRYLNADGSQAGGWYADDNSDISTAVQAYMDYYNNKNEIEHGDLRTKYLEDAHAKHGRDGTILGGNDFWAGTAGSPAQILGEGTGMPPGNGVLGRGFEKVLGIR